MIHEQTTQKLHVNKVFPRRFNFCLICEFSFPSKPLVNVRKGRWGGAKHLIQEESANMRHSKQPVKWKQHQTGGERRTQHSRGAFGERAGRTQRGVHVSILQLMRLVISHCKHDGVQRSLQPTHTDTHAPAHTHPHTLTDKHSTVCTTLTLTWPLTQTL